MKPNRKSNPYLPAVTLAIATAAAIALPFDTTSAATVTLTASNAAGTSSFSSATGWSDAAAPSAGNDYVVASGFSLRTVADSGSATFAGNSLTLGNNTTAGVLVLKNQVSGAIVTINNLTLNNGEIQTGGNAAGTANIVTIAGNGITLAASTAANRLNTGTSGRGIIVSAPISGSGALSIINGGAATLTGANSYTGTTTITSTTLNLGSGGTTGSLSASSAIVNNGTLVFNRSDSIIQGTDFGTISGTGAVTKAGAGTVTLSSANTYAGATTVNGGTLAAGVASVAGTSGAFGLNSAVTLANTAGVGLDITGFDTQIGSLAGGGATGGNVTLGAATLTLGGGDKSGSYAGVISGTGGVTKIGTGTETFTSANTYSGATTIGGGTLALSGTAGALASGSSIINNGTLSFVRTNAVVQGTDFSSASIIGTGALSHTGTGGILTLNVGNGYTGTTTIGAAANNSVLRATATGALGSGTIQFDSTGNASTARLELSGGITLANPTIQFAGRNNTTVGIQNISGNNTLSGTLNLQAGGSTYTVQSDAGQLTLSGGIANASGTGTRTLTVAGAGDTLISGMIGNGTGTTALTKSGGGTLTLDNTNTYGGATAVTAGTLLVNGALANTTTSVSSGATLGGTGSIAGSITVSAGGFLSPGTSIESLNVASASLLGTLITEYDGTGAGTIDLLGVSGILDITAATVDFNQIGETLAGPSYVFANYGTLMGSQFANVMDLPTGYEIDYAFGGNNIALVAIPEPAAALLGGLGVLALLRRRRR